MSKDIEDKYIATMLLHALGDTIGFKNGDWEFFKDNTVYGATLEKLYEFIDLGGINDIDLENWIVSDDTILHMAIARSLILGYGDLKELEDNTAKHIVRAVDAMKRDEENKKNRYVGNAVAKHVDMIHSGSDWRKFEFDKYGGGNGSAMRSNCIGLAFFGEENRSKLIEYSIMSSKITHVNPIGWLGGLSVALMTAFAMEKNHLYKWIPKMLEILESKEVKKYLDFKNSEETNAFEQFTQCWKSYYDARFSNGKPTKDKSQKNLIQRLVFYNNIFEVYPMGKMGTSGYSAVIVAYDCLIDADNQWEKLVIYAMVNNFDTDTIGAIAGGLFGTIYGLEKIPKNNLKHIEFGDKLIKMGKLLYKKYFLHDKIN